MSLMKMVRMMDKSISIFKNSCGTYRIKYVLPNLIYVMPIVRQYSIFQKNCLHRHLRHFAAKLMHDKSFAFVLFLLQINKLYTT